MVHFSCAKSEAEETEEAQERQADRGPTRNCRLVQRLRFESNLTFEQAARKAPWAESVSGPAAGKVIRETIQRSV